ncbi:uncharacterized protein LOC122856403 [Aphidius gifuensis]|uniref:uncharacterized protein LOC122856403 n=1 Tax=Aphidius gifuensis TaxID=684658 RepID=UPI001CDC5D1B|nr:uncharacterized protein LOC122856403 [Aphidius gifuensis]
MAIVSTETQRYPVRLLIDTGLELSFVTDSLVHNLQLSRTRLSIEIYGIGGKNASKTRGKVSVKLESKYRKISVTIDTHILTKITTLIPAVDIRADLQDWPHINKLKLADPQFLKSQSIDIIIGADYYGSIIKPNIIKHSDTEPVAQLSVFGWLILGPISIQKDDYLDHCSESIIFEQERGSYHTQVTQNCQRMTQSHLSGSIISNQNLDNLLTRFWEQEEIQAVKLNSYTQEEQDCEQHFKNTHSRDETGRYIVRLPVNKSSTVLGSSYLPAHKCLQRIIKRLEKDTTYKELYLNFMEEYEELGHMRRVPDKINNTRAHYYLPHHGVLRPSSTTTKLRVVFNGSCNTDTNKSLNDIMHAGPNLLLNIADVLLWIRSFKHLFSTDITKMFRQIKVHEEDWDLQRILWTDQHGNEQPYQLTTVTYGTKAAPYLANKTLIQLTEDEGTNFPLAVTPILKGRYVDDIFGGADTMEELMEIVTQLTALCMAGGFPLAKWHFTSHHENSQETNQRTTTMFDNCETKILSINWSPTIDQFSFTFTESQHNRAYTKRLILSEVATIFDPLGFVSPVIIRAKILLQELWLNKLGWDDTLPTTISTAWETIRKEMKSLTRLFIPRWFNTKSDTVIDLHGFSDASQLAMAAAIYLTVYTPSNGAETTLVCSKTKVAPLKRITIPRLELTAALLLAKLVTHTQTQLQFKIRSIHLWTDSTVTLT